MRAMGFKHLIRRIRVEDAIPAGPATAEDVHKWCGHVVDRVVRHRKADFAWMKGAEVLLSVKWAGLGGMCMGWLYLVHEMRRRPDLPDLALRVISFTDYEETCQGHHHTQNVKDTQTNQNKENTETQKKRNAPPPHTNAQSMQWSAPHL